MTSPNASVSLWIGAAFAAVALATALPAGAQSAIKPAEVRNTGVEIMARLPLEPDKVSVTSDGRIIFSVRAYGNDQPRVAELMPDGSVRPFPSADWVGPRRADGKGFNQVVGLMDDDRGLMWILDRADKNGPPRVLGWNLKTNKLEHGYQVPKLGKGGSEWVFQDLAFDRKHRLVYLAAREENKRASASMPVIVVFDPVAGTVRFIRLEKPEAEKESPLAAVGVPYSDNNSTPSLMAGLNVPICITPDYKWVYFTYMNGNKVWRVKSEDLANPDLSTREISQRVERHCTKPMSNGIVADNDGNVYVADEAKKSIGVYEPEKGYRSQALDSILEVPYGLTLGDDGYVYVTVRRPNSDNPDLANATKYDKPYLLARVKQVPPRAK